MGVRTFRYRDPRAVESSTKLMFPIMAAIPSPLAFWRIPYKRADEERTPSGGEVKQQWQFGYDAS